MRGSAIPLEPKQTASRRAVSYRRAALCLCLCLGYPAVNAPAQPGIPEATFVVERYAVEGDNPISAEQTQELLADFLGTHTGIEGLGAAADALEQKIRGEGYAFHRVIVPPQRTDEGVIRLQVLAFKLAKVEVKGNEHFSEENVLASLPALKPGETPNNRDLSRSLAFANRHSAKQVRVSVKESEELDAIDVTVNVRDRRPWNIFSSFNNRGSAETGRTRISVGFQHSNLFGWDHSATVSYTTSPGHASQVSQYGLHYQLPFYTWAGNLELFATKSDVDSGTIANFFDVSGKGTFFGARYNQTLFKIGDYSQGLFFGIEDKLFENDVDFLGTPLGVDVRTRPISVGYNGRWDGTWGSAGIHGGYARNLSGGSDNTDTAYRLSRTGADREWDAIRYGAHLSYRLPQNWELRSRLTGQYANEPLVSGEQFGIGGANSVRGLEEREVSGDDGASVSVEMYSPQVLGNVRFLGFVDAGRVTIEQPQAGQQRVQTASSFGAGFRWFWKTNLSASADIAYVLDGGPTTDSGDKKLHFNILGRF